MKSFHYYSIILLCVIFLYVSSATGGEKDYPYPYNLYEGRIHDGWIDLNNNGEMDIYENPKLSVEQRTNDLISRMTLEEKATQLGPTNTAAIDRLGIPAYRWWQEASHGVANYGRSKNVTVFPQKIGLAASWDLELIRKIYTVVSDEARARFHEGKLDSPPSLNFYSPSVVGIMRDTRWQRTEESFGEDPYLTSRLAVVTFRAFQGEDDGYKYKKTIGTAKHYVSNRGPHGKDHPYTPMRGPISERLMREICFPPYKASIQEGNVGEIMSAYSRRPTGLSPAWIPCSYSKPLLTGVLRDEWGFEGHITSDCWAIRDSMGRFNSCEDTNSKAGAAAVSIKAGVDINCGDTNISKNILEALEKGWLTEKDIDKNLFYLLKSRFELGLFDPPDMVPYTHFREKDVATKENIQLALETARKTTVLLKNKDNVLPLNKDELKTIAVVGPSVDQTPFGGYSGRPPYSVSILQGLNNKLSEKVKIHAVTGKITKEILEKSKSAAKKSDVVVIALGPPKEGEGDTRPDLDLPEGQLELLQAVHEAGKPVIAVLLGGSPLSNSWMFKHTQAILEAWYPGMEGGNAIADIIFGDYNPGAKLPITYPKLGMEPLYYNHKGKISYDKSTYIYPFGHGLSYTNFRYENLRISPQIVIDNDVAVKVDIINTGDREGDAVPQLYLRDVMACVETPVKQLKGFDRITLKPGEKKTVEFIIPFEELSLLDKELNRIVEPGKFEVMIGKSSENIILTDCFIVNKMTKLKGGPNYNYKKFTLENKNEKSRNPFTVKANEPFIIKAVAENSGEITGWTEVKAYKNGGVIQKRKIGLCPGEEKLVSFEVSLFTPGEQKIAVENLPPQTVMVKEREPEFFFSGELKVNVENYPKPVEISSLIINKGSTKGKKKIDFKVNGEKIESKKVTIPAAPGGGKAKVYFTHNFKRGGIYTVQVGNSPITEITLPDIQLSGNWKFRKGDDPSWKEPEFDDSEWQTVELPNNWEDHSEYIENHIYGWYRKKVYVPKDWKDYTLEVTIGKIDDVDECFFNGHKIGQTGEFPKNEDYNTMVGRWQVLRKYTVPEKCIRYGENNIIAVRVFDGVGGGGIYSDVGGIRLIKK